MTRLGLVSGSIPTSPKKGGHRAALHGAAGGQRSGLPGRDGPTGSQELSGPAPCQAGSARSRPRQAGDRLRSAGQRLRFRGLPTGQRRGRHAALRASHRGQRLPERGRGLDRSRSRADLCDNWAFRQRRRRYNLSTHSAPDVLLFSLLHPRWEFVFQPKYAAYLNLIEPWWKVLRSLALKGRRFETWAEIEQAVERATAYWNDHKHPFIWGHRRRHRPSRRFGVAALPAISLI